MSLDLFLQILLPFPLFLFSADYFSGLIDVFVFAGPSIRELNEVLGLSFLSFGLMVEVVPGGRRF